MALAVTAAVPASAAPPTRQAFSKEMIARFRKADPSAVFAADPADPLHVMVTRPVKPGDKPETAQIFFDRIYAYCQQAPAADCEASKARWVRGMGQPPGALTLSSLRVIVRGKDYAEAAAQRRGDDDQLLALIRPIGDDLYMILASDSPDAIAMLSSAGLEKLEVTEAQAWLLAETQTRGILPQIPTAPALRKAWQGFQGDAYMGSVAMDLPAWQKLADEVGPDLFMTVATDQIVIVGLVPDGKPLDDLADAVRADCAAAERCISPHVFRFRDGKWIIAK